ncbi:MAG TPA: hypothetical protein VLE99_01525 [Candidatus Saccharimonadales bacterium]|nr:hypothetical protein [Candidatus Saccharimonadales bacterium]
MQVYRSIESLFTTDTPDVLWRDPRRYAAVALDVHPATHHHLLVVIRTPDAARSQVRMPWHHLPAAIRQAGHLLVDLAQERLYEMVAPPDVVTTVMSGRSVIEPHVHLMSGGDPTELWRAERYHDTNKLEPDLCGALAGEIDFWAVAERADTIFEGVDFSPLGRPD